MDAERRESRGWSSRRYPLPLGWAHPRSQCKDTAGVRFWRGLNTKQKNVDFILKVTRLTQRVAYWNLHFREYSQTVFRGPGEGAVACSELPLWASQVPTASQLSKLHSCPLRERWLFFQESGKGLPWSPAGQGHRLLVHYKRVGTPALIPGKIMHAAPGREKPLHCAAKCFCNSSSPVTRSLALKLSYLRVVKADKWHSIFLCYIK